MQGSVGAESAQLPLAKRADFTLGKVVLRPSLRTVSGPGGEATAEPRVMQVILALIDAGGAVLSRDDLLRTCWDGRIVGDDAINRAVAEARRISAATGAEFHIETIPRVGYRLNAADGAVPVPTGKMPAIKLSRRALLGVAAGAAGVAGLAGWIIAMRNRDAEVDALLERGTVLYDESADVSIAASSRLFRRASELAPDRADAKGLLALSLFRLSNMPSSRDARAQQTVREVAQAALDLDPAEPTARTVMTILRRGLEDWVALETELREIIASAPGHVASRFYLGRFLVAVGRCNEALDMNRQTLALRPFSPQFNFGRALLLWIVGREGEAYRVIERASELWPTHPFVWNARLTILAFTGRSRIALGMLDNRTMQPFLAPDGAAMWRASLEVMESRSTADTSRARAAILAAAVSSPGASANAIMLLSWLGHVDSAYELAEGFLLRRGDLAGGRAPSANPSRLYSDTGWRDTQWLFTPATARLRDDPRFPALCHSLGYSDYWRRRGVWPDAAVRGSLRPG